MKRIILFFLSTFFANISFSQQDTIGDPSSGYPYYVTSPIGGTESYVMHQSFAGSSDTSQIIFRTIFGSPIFLDSFQIFVWENDEQVQFFPGKVLQVDQTVYLYNGSEYLGQDKVQIGEGVWSPISRIMANYTPEPVALEMPGTVKQEQPQVSLVKEEAKTLTDWLKGICIAFLVVLAFIVVVFLLRKIGNLALDFISWVICYFQNRRQQKLEAEKAKILVNLEKLSVEEAGPPQVPGGVSDFMAEERLSQIARTSWQEIKWFVPVKVRFLREVRIGYADGIEVVAHPQNEQDRLYFLGKTTKDEYVLCVRRCGNGIIGVDGSSIQLGKDFCITNLVQVTEVAAYFEAIKDIDKIGAYRPELPIAFNFKEKYSF